MDERERPKRRGRTQAYVPPHQRRSHMRSDDPGQKPSTSSRRLDELTDVPYRWDLRLRGLPQEAAAATLATCPCEPVEAAEGTEGGLVLHFPIDGREDLIHDVCQWFADAGAELASMALLEKGQALSLLLPQQLTKRQRKEWHEVASRCGLPKRSSGVGDARHLEIFSPSMPLDVDGHLEGEDASWRQAKRVWRWAQSAGGDLWEVSQGEIREMLRANALSPALEALCNTHAAGAELHAAIAARKDAEALELLSQHDASTLAWVRDEDSGEFPVVTAIRAHCNATAIALLRRPGVAQQRAADYASLADVAAAEFNAEVGRALREESWRRPPGL